MTTPEKPEPTEQQLKPPKTPPFPVLTPEELCAHGVPTHDTLIISPVPRKR
jgi:hypothetical protein